jgi:hypothetical protein
MPEWSWSGTGVCTCVEHAFPRGVTLSTMIRLRGFERTVDEGPTKPPTPLRCAKTEPEIREVHATKLIVSIVCLYSRPWAVAA